MIVDLTREEIEDVISNLEQCKSEGYVNYGDAAYSAMYKMIEVLDE